MHNIKIIKLFTSRETRLRRNEFRQIVQFDFNIIYMQQLFTHGVYMYIYKVNSIYEIQNSLHQSHFIPFRPSFISKLIRNYSADYNIAKGITYKIVVYYLLTKGKGHIWPTHVDTQCIY